MRSTTAFGSSCWRGGGVVSCSNRHFRLVPLFSSITLYFCLRVCLAVRFFVSGPVCHIVGIDFNFVACVILSDFGVPTLRMRVQDQDKESRTHETQSIIGEVGILLRLAAPHRISSVTPPPQRPRKYPPPTIATSTNVACRLKTRLPSLLNIPPPYTSSPIHCPPPFKPRWRLQRALGDGRPKAMAPRTCRTESRDKAHPLSDARRRAGAEADVR